MRKRGRAPGHGFDVHARTRISAHDRQGRERLCRYLTRPPLVERRLERLPNGNARLGLKRPWADGTTSVLFEPLDLLSKLAALVPPPRMHRTRYHGVWSSHAKVRREVTPSPPTSEPSRCGCEPEAHPRESPSKRYAWARLLARVFAIDVLSCPKCGAGRMQRVAFVTQPGSIRAILSSVGLSADSPAPAPSRLALQEELFETA